jgi:hypothetical protein
MKLSAPLIALLLVTFAFCAPVAPVFEDTAALTTAEGLGIGSRYIGMGGAGVAVVDDAASLYWNPAGLSYGEGNELEIDAYGQVNDVDLLSKLRHGISILRRGSSNLSSDDVNDLVGIAQQANGRPLEGTAGAIAALRLHHFALGAWGRGVGDFEFNWNGSLTSPIVSAGGVPGDEDINTTAVNSAGTLTPALVAWSINAGLGWAKQWSPKVRAGFTLRQQMIDVRQATASGSIVSGVSSGTVSEVFEDHAEKYTGDLGFIFTPEDNIRLGLVLRNLAEPEYRLGYNGSVLDVPTSRSLDAGFAAFSGDHRTIVAGDLHNLTSADGGHGSFHLGIEHRFTNWFTLRMGTATDNSFCWGFDLIPFKALVLRAASSTSLGQQLGAGVQLRF